MAYIEEEDEENQEAGMNVLADEAQPQSEQTPSESDQPQQEIQTADAAPSEASSGQPSVPQSTGPQPAPAPKPTKPQGSGLFRDFRKYIKAGEGSAQKISGAAQEGIQQQTQGLEQKEKKFQKRLTGGAEQFIRAKEGAGSTLAKLQKQDIATQKEKAIQKELTKVTDPTKKEYLQKSLADTQQLMQKSTLTPEEIAQYRGLATGQTKFNEITPETFGQEQAKSKVLGKLAGQLGGESGKQQLLRQTFGGKARPYTKGQQSLDVALLGADKPVAEQLQQKVTQQAQQFGGDVAAAKKAALRGVGNLRSSIEGLVGDEGEAMQAITGDKGRLTSLQKAVEEKQAGALADFRKKRSAITERMKRGANLSDSELDSLGVAPEQRGMYRNYLTQYNLGQFVKDKQLEDFKFAELADEGQRAKYNTLAGLAGKDALGESRGSNMQFQGQEAMLAVLNAQRQSKGLDPIAMTTQGQSTPEQTSLRDRVIQAGLGQLDAGVQKYLPKDLTDAKALYERISNPQLGLPDMPSEIGGALEAGQQISQAIDDPQAAAKDLLMQQTGLGDIQQQAQQLLGNPAQGAASYLANQTGLDGLESLASGGSIEDAAKQQVLSSLADQAGLGGLEGLATGNFSLEDTAKKQLLSSLSGGFDPGSMAMSAAVQGLVPDKKAFSVGGAELGLQDIANVGLSIVNPAYAPTAIMQSGQNLLNVANNTIDKVPVLRDIYKPIHNIANKVSSVFKSVFCFASGTPIRMANGGIKNIEDLKLGDDTYLGGMVLGTGDCFARGSMYKYHGKFMTESHAMFIDGKWTRAENCEGAVKTDLPATTVVHPVVTENSLLVSGDFISADFQEIDLPHGYTDEEKLDMLNDMKERNEWLLEEEVKLKELENGHSEIQSKEGLRLIKKVV